MENDAKVAGARLDTMNATLDQLKKQAASTSDQDVQLRALEREAKSQRDLFESYLAKYREATARDSIAAAPADARVISRAVVSNLPFSPKKVPIVLIAALGTFCLSSAFVVTGALLSGEPSSNRQVAYEAEPVITERQPPPRSNDARTRASIWKSLPRLFWKPSQKLRRSGRCQSIRPLRPYVVLARVAAASL